MKIADLLIRCVVEIEAIVKELYFKNGGTKTDDNNLYFDTDCMAHLESLWGLSKKVVLISSIYCFISDEKKILYPFHKAYKRGTSGADWAKAYQAIKHNRTEELKKGNIYNLIKAAAVLFILNIYYQDRIYNLGNDNSDKFSKSLSDLFSFKVHTWRSESFENDEPYQKGADFDECTFLIKYTNDYHDKYQNWGRTINQKINDAINTNPKVIKYIQDNFIKNDGTIRQTELQEFFRKRKYFETCIDLKTEYAEIIRRSTIETNRETKFNMKDFPSEFEAVVNKNQPIYTKN
jgi:hypothetical protein